MNSLEEAIMQAEANLYSVLNSGKYPVLDEAAELLSFRNTETDHEYRVALYNVLMSNARYLESTATILTTLTEAHGLPKIC